MLLHKFLIARLIVVASRRWRQTQAFPRPWPPATSACGCAARSARSLPSSNMPKGSRMRLSAPARPDRSAKQSGAACARLVDAHASRSAGGRSALPSGSARFRRPRGRRNNCSPCCTRCTCSKQNMKNSPSSLRPTGARWVPGSSQPSHWQVGALVARSASGVAAGPDAIEIFRIEFMELIIVELGIMGASARETRIDIRRTLNVLAGESAISWHRATHARRPI